MTIVTSGRDTVTLAGRQITELAAHGWDLVKAAGQKADPDPALAPQTGQVTTLTWGATREQRP
jgi:hypothetical protein